MFRRVDGSLHWVVPKNAKWKTREKVKRDYRFPKMTQFIKKYVRACIPCAYSKQAGGKKQCFV